jgi:ATP-dependent HslUV protease ATP-binding subunit HslU
MEKLVDMSDVSREAIQSVEESGIVFIDEIDKICNPGTPHISLHTAT